MKAILLAAGLGMRMRPLTNDKPKPLVTIKGRALIDYSVDHLRKAHISQLIVNAHYKAEQIEAWAQSQQGISIVISDERDQLLDTGGAIVKALPLLGDEPFFVLNSDSFWIDRARPALARLQEFWQENSMDCLLLITDIDQTVGYFNKGDFTIDDEGRLQRPVDSLGKLYAYSGCYLVHPRLFADCSVEKFSMNVLWNKAIANKRLFGLIHDGLWVHVGTPDALRLAEEAL